MEIRDNELEKLYAETFQGIESGSILKGMVVAVRPENVVVDVGYKSEGIIPRDEFSPEEYASLKPGDHIEVYVAEIRDGSGVIELSRERAQRIKAWKVLEEAMNSAGDLEGRIVGKTKGGMFVDIMGVRAFLPGSHLDVRGTKDPDSLIGKKMHFRILKMNSKRSNIIVSHRVIVEQEREQKKAKTLEVLKEGAALKGIVKNITDYGVFVDLGGIDGLLHISDISWGRISHPSEYFSSGQEIEVLVIKYDPEAGKVTLGYKQKRNDPWTEVDQRYPVGTRVKGKVVSITDYGAFIEIEEGLEGLVHVSEIDWSPRPKHPSKYLEKGDEVEAVVLKVDKNDRRLSLSLKQLKQSPWQLVAEKYQIGQIITGKVRGITEFGAFIGLPEGVDGLVHVSDLSWTKHIRHPSEMLKKGQTVDAVIISIEPEKERMALGLKQLKEDPWDREIAEKYRLGDAIDCAVLRITDFGLFVEFGEEIEGLVYSSEIVQPEGGEIKEGDKIKARIIKIDADNRKIGLSMKNAGGQAE